MSAEAAENENEDSTNESSTSPSAVEARAKQLGWAPKDQWRGDASKWIDAQEFVDRGENIIPLIKAQNRRLEDELGSTRGELKQLQTQLIASQEAIEALKEVNNASNLRKVKDDRRDLIVQKKKAEEAGDDDLVLDLETQIQDQTAAIREAEKAEKAPKAKKETTETKPTDPAKTPEFRAWASENPWWGVDQDRSDLALVIGMRLKRDSANQSLSQKQFMDKVSAEVEKKLGPYGASESRPSKVEGGRSNGSSSSGSGKGRKKTYSDLPTDVKAACDKFSTRLVGAGKAYKTAAEYQQYYADKYFEGSEEE